MAAGLGSLVVNLGLDATQFIAGMTKSEHQAQRFAKKIDSEFAAAAASIGKLFALFGGGAAAGLFIRNTIAEASALDDLADSTGSSVEALSKLNNQAKIAGTDLATLTGYMEKLAAGMAGADEESSKVGRALKALGVEAKDPAVALNEIAVKLNTYADGIGKAAIARDLFGKSGVAFLATLKDIAEAQDVAATVTAKMAADAEALEKALRRLNVEATGFRDAILSGMVPAVVNLIAEMREGIAIAGGFWAALIRFGTVNPFASLQENIDKADRNLKKLRGMGADAATIARVEQEKAFLQFQQRQQAMAGAAALGYTGDVRDARANRKPELAYAGAGRDRAAKAAKEQITDAERYLKSLQEQVDKTRELTVYDRVLNDLLSGRLELSRGITAEQLLGLAQQIDASAALRKNLEEEARARETASRALTRAQESGAAEVARIAESNEALKNEIALIGADAAKRAEQAQALNAVAIARKEDALFAEQSVNGMSTIALLLEDEIRLLRERGLLIAQRGVAEKVAEDAKKAKEFVDSLGMSFASAFEDAIVSGKALRDVLRGLEQDIVRIITRKLVTEPLAAGIGDLLGALGKGSSGGGGGWLASLFGSLLGGGGASSLAGAGGGAGNFNWGGGFASGTSFAPGGLALVGERGPEVVNLPRGSQVIPNNKIGRGLAPVINIAVHQAPGASRASSEQLAAETGRAVQRAMRSVR